jgi:hypothetical protein
MFRVKTAPIDPARIVGFDTVAKLTGPTARRLASAGLSFAGRYVALRAPGAGDLDASELEEVTNAGLGVMPIQYARTGGWSADSGRTDGAAAARNALAVGVPPEATLWCDLEGRIPGAEAAIAYATNWHAAATEAGIADPGLYVGAGIPLTSEQLFHDLPFRRYWRSLSQVPNVDVRGYQLIQLFPDDVVVAGVRVDLDVVQSDYRQNRPVWVALG